MKIITNFLIAILFFTLHINPTQAQNASKEDIAQDIARVETPENLKAFSDYVKNNPQAFNETQEEIIVKLCKQCDNCKDCKHCHYCKTDCGKNWKKDCKGPNCKYCKYCKHCKKCKVFCQKGQYCCTICHKCD